MGDESVQPEQAQSSMHLPGVHLYVCGFAFVSAASSVILLRKQRPFSQQGMYNGTGGEIKDGETAEEAMYREAEEELGLGRTEPGAFSDQRRSLVWERTVTLTLLPSDTDNGWVVHFYRTFIRKNTAEKALYHAAMRTDEPAGLFPVDHLPRMMVPNAYRLIHLMLDEHFQFPIRIMAKRA